MNQPHGVRKKPPARASDSSNHKLLVSRHEAVAVKSDLTFLQSDALVTGRIVARGIMNSPRALELVDSLLCRQQPTPGKSWS